MITTPPPTLWRINRREYYRLGELGFFDDKRVELIEGLVYEKYPRRDPYFDDVHDDSPLPSDVWRVNREEYHRLGELGFFNSKRVQLIEGKVIEMSPMDSPHATAVQLCEVAAENLFGNGYSVRCQLPLVVAGWSEPQPDIAVVKGAIRDYADEHPETAMLVIEVADSSIKIDCGPKARSYAKADVRDYWVVDLNARRVHIFREPNPAKGVYQQHEIRKEGESLSALHNPSISIAVADLLP